MPTSGDVTIRTLFDAEAIAARNEALAREIKAAALDRMLVVAVLKGSFIFAADLIRSLHAAGLAPEVEFVSLSSYREGTVSSGTVRILHDVESDVRGRDVLLVDDILESGFTLGFAKNLLTERGAHRVWVCTLLDKPEKRRAPLTADFVGFRAGDEFLVGYGLDWAHRFRGLPYIGVVEKPAA